MYLLVIHTVCSYVHAYIHVYICVYVLTVSECMYMCVYVHVHIHNYIHTPCTCSQNSLRMMQSLKGSRASNRKVVCLQMDCTCPIRTYKLNSQVILKSHCSIPIWIAGSPASMECAHTSTYLRTYLCQCVYLSTCSRFRWVWLQIGAGLCVVGPPFAQIGCLAYHCRGRGSWHGVPVNLLKG